jgi:hypothetical protein
VLSRSGRSGGNREDRIRIDSRKSGGIDGEKGGERRDGGGGRSGRSLGHGFRTFQQCRQGHDLLAEESQVDHIVSMQLIRHAQGAGRIQFYWG